MSKASTYFFINIRDNDTALNKVPSKEDSCQVEPVIALMNAFIVK